MAAIRYNLGFNGSIVVPNQAEVKGTACKPRIDCVLTYRLATTKTLPFSKCRYNKNLRFFILHLPPRG